MNELLNKAKELLEKEQLTCCFAGDGFIYKSRDRGVRPLLSFLEEKRPSDGLCAADKVIGKAAAFLYVLIGIRCIYADVISERALEVFEKYGVDISYTTLVPAIKNRAGDGFCPMETAVSDIDSPDRALVAIRAKLKELSAK